MSGNAVEGDVPDGATLAGAHEGAAGAARFGDDGAHGLLGHRGEPFAGGERTHFFVGVVADGDGETVEVFLAGVLEGVEDGDDAGLAVGAARAVDRAVLDAERTLGDGAIRVDRVEMGVEHDVELFSARLVRGEETAAGLVAEVDEFGGEADFVIVALHDFGDARDAVAGVAAAVDVDDFFEVLQIGFKHSLSPLGDSVVGP